VAKTENLIQNALRGAANKELNYIELCFKY